MKRSRKPWVVLAAMPVVAVLGVGAANAAPQPGLAAPGQGGQPALSTSPAPPPEKPTIVDAIIPDPPRPRPVQQTQPQVQMVIQPQTDPEADDDSVDAQAEEAVEPAPAGPQPRLLRFGTELVPVPDWLDPGAQAVVQDLADKAEWWIAAGFDAAGLPQDESDRRAAATAVGGLAGASVGANAAGFVGGLAGCFTGMALGGVVGGVAAGLASAGTLAPFGAFAGGLAGCMGGAALVGIPATVVGLGVGWTVGAGAAAALGTRTNLPPAADAAPPEPPAEAPAEPTCDSSTQPAAETTPVSQPIPAPAPDPMSALAAPLVQTAASVVDQVSAVGDAVMGSLRDAVAEMPSLAPEIPFSAPINGLIDAAQTALGVAQPLPQ